MKNTIQFFPEREMSEDEIFDLEPQSKSMLKGDLVEAIVRAAYERNELLLKLKIAENRISNLQYELDTALNDIDEIIHNAANGTLEVTTVNNTEKK